MSNTLSQIGTKVGTEFKAHRLRIETLEDALDLKITSTEKGVANGVATLDASGKVPSSQLPSYVDDVVEAANLGSFPTTGETGKIYVALDTNKAYRWSGSAYIYITSGAVDSVAGKTGVVTLVKGDVGLGNVDNTADADKPISTATQSALNAKQATITGAATTITSSNLTASMVLVSDASGKVAAHGTVSATELGYLDGVTSAIQTQLNGKEPTITTLPVSKGGTGVTTLTGLVKGNGTGAFSTAVAGTDYVIPSGSITGNAGTATKLSTARTINGVSFDGTANITIADSTKLATTGGTMTGAITSLRETSVAMVVTNNVDLATGNHFTKIISGATTLTVSNVPAIGQMASFILELTNGGSAAITWWSGVKWAGGTAPTLTSAGFDILGFYTKDGGTTWRGLVLAKDSK